MAIRRIIRMGHPVLRQVARELTPDEIRSPEIDMLIADMADTLRDYGGVGLAAPQVGEPVRLALIEMGSELSRYGDLPQIPLTVFINPVIEVIDKEQAGFWEGCLSVPGLRGFVERPQHIRVSYTTETGERAGLELRGFPATVFQHEFDHLDGVLYVDRISDTRRLAFDEEFERYHLA